MNVAMMDVRVMRVAMGDGWMNVGVDVWLRAIPCERMFVPVMFVMSMGMDMIESIVTMRMCMVLGYVQPDADAHQGGRRRQ